MQNDEMVARINMLKNEKNAVILAHNYCRPEVQDIADYSGDSLALSRIAAGTDADIIVFCGVHFMAETAYILSPQKMVLLPDSGAGCPMADMISADQLMKLKAEYPEATVIAYVNSSAAVKAETDICCTSGNAVNLMNHLSQVQDIIFVPDKHLGTYLSRKSGKQFKIWDGYCPVHQKITPEDIIREKKKHPEAKVLAHPECSQAVLDLADAVLSTEGICRYAAESDVMEIIYATEIGIRHRLEKENPDKRFYPASEFAVCHDMKKITLEKIVWSLEHLEPVIRVPDDICRKARKAVDRMIEIV